MPYNMVFNALSYGMQILTFTYKIIHHNNICKIKNKKIELVRDCFSDLHEIE